jgi:hypothetical protein
MFSYPFSAVGPAIDATAKTTIKVTHFIHHISGEGAKINVISPPAEGFTGPVIFIGDTENEEPQFESGEGNIAEGEVAAFKRATIFVFDGERWYPNSAR